MAFAFRGCGLNAAEAVVDRRFEITPQQANFEQDAVLQFRVPILDLVLRLRAGGSSRYSLSLSSPDKPSAFMRFQRVVREIPRTFAASPIRPLH